ncbi:MAG: HEPN domain-containing protein [Phycisphaeraceae bacterium]|nr:HEPN domain-containing protein [Phycisphaeraceae bacterium]
MTPLTQEWVEKAEGDFEAARWVMQAPKVPYDAVCFHAQQCVEKYLKARLQEANLAFPKTHDLEQLLALILPAESGWAVMRADLAVLSRFAVEYRYPGTTATNADAQDSLRRCTAVRQVIRKSLGLMS